MTSKTPRQDTRGIAKEKKSGRKRQSETPSSGNILKYIRVKSKNKEEDDISDGGGGQVLISVSEQEQRQNITQNKKEECGVDDKLENCDELESRKTTFTTVEGGVSVPEGGGDIVGHDDRDVCVFSGGKCITHSVKLQRSVRQKKMSVVNKMGQVSWKYRDVTCLICPSRAIMKGLSAKTIRSEVKGN